MTPSTRPRLAVAGAGGMGREALAWVRDARPDAVVVGFLVRDEPSLAIHPSIDLPVFTSFDHAAMSEVTAVILGIGDNSVRKTVAEQVRAAGLKVLTVVHPHAFLGPGIELGEGVLVAPGAVLTRDVAIGAGSIVNYQSSVGHDSRLADFTFIGPGAVVTGDVTIGTGATIGAGAVLLPGMRIGARATVGAGAVVTRDVPDGHVVVGNPARVVDELPAGDAR